MSRYDSYFTLALYRGTIKKLTSSIGKPFFDITFSDHVREMCLTIKLPNPDKRCETLWAESLQARAKER